MPEKRNGVEVTTVESMEDFSRLSEPWNDLLHASTADTAFLTWDWQYSWAESYIKDQRKLSIVTIRENGDLIGIAPWYTRTIRKGLLSVRRIEFLGTPEADSDYLDVIARKGNEKKVASCLYDYLFKRSCSSWDVLYLNDVPAASAFLLFFLRELRSVGKHFEVEYGSYCPLVVLPETEEDYLKSLSSHRRQHHNRALRNLQKLGELQFEQFTSDADNAALKRFQDLYENRWKKGKGEFFSFLHRYIGRVGGAKKVEIDLLAINRNLIGGLIHINHNRTKHQYLMAVDRSFNKNVSIGEVMCGKYIKDAIARQFNEYDFLKGDEAHKFIYANRARCSLNLLLFNRSLRGILAFSTEKTKNIGKVILR